MEYALRAYRSQIYCFLIVIGIITGMLPAGHGRGHPERVNAEELPSPTPSSSIPDVPTPKDESFQFSKDHIPELLKKSNDKKQDMELSDIIQNILSASSAAEVLHDSNQAGNAVADALDSVFSKEDLNDQIKKTIRLYTEKRRGDLEAGLQNAQPYLEMITKKLQQRSLPQEILWIPLIESGFNPTAKSFGAVGMWQLIPATARRFGLRVDDWLDERADPEQSTEAALDTLEYLYEKTGSWLLSFAAYNLGEARIINAINTHNTTDYWELVRKKEIPSQTNYYVSAILALSYILRNPAKYGMPELNIQPFPWSDTLYVDEAVDLRFLAQCLGIDEKELLKLNPSLKRGRIPPKSTNFPLRIPYGTRDNFLEKYMELPSYKPANVITHRVEMGETLSRIAEKYNSSVEAIMSLNKMEESFIRAGGTLLIPIGNE